MSLSFVGNDSVPRVETGGDREAFERLYADSSRELWALAYAACGESEAAMDCVQQVFVEFQRLELHPEEIGVMTWLRTRVRELAAAMKPNPNAPAKTDDRFAAVRAALESMPADMREVAALRYTLDYTPERIAGVLGRPSGEVAHTLALCRQRLANHLRLSPDGTETA